MIRRAFLALCLTAAMTSICSADFFNTDYAAAAKDSRETGRTLVVLISASWCSPCQQLKNDIKKAEKAGALPDVNLVIVDYKSEVAKKIKVSSSIPQLIRFEKKEGKWFKTFSVGYLSPQKFKDFCNGKK